MNQLEYRLTSAFDVSGTKSFRLSSRMLFGEIGCLVPIAEVLTKAGWVRFLDLQEGTPVAQWDPKTSKISWTPAVIIKGHYKGTLLCADGQLHQTMYTPNHRIYAKPRVADKTWRPYRADDLSTIKSMVLPLAGTLDEGKAIDPNILRMVVACQADAGLEGQSWRITFCKERKNIRLNLLASQLNIALRQQKAEEGYWRYAFHFDESVFLDTRTKTFSWDILHTSLACRLAFLDELRHWDGMTRNKSWLYYTTNSKNARLVATVAHCSGYSANIWIDRDNNNGYGSGDNLPLYTVNIKPRTYAYDAPCEYDIEPYEGRVFCLKTPTGAFLVRQNGKIHVTGNSNLQNMPESMRSFMIPDHGKSIFQVDQSGAEALVVAYLAERGAYRELFDVGIKPHTYIALNIFIDKFRGKQPRDRYQFRRPAELVQLPEWKELNKFISKDPGNVTEYQLGKRVAHAKSYGMGPNTFRTNVLQESQGSILLSYAEAKHFLTMFEKLFPEVIDWQGRLINEAIANRRLYNLFGYPRELCGRWNNELEREALSYIPQSTVGVLTSIVFTELHDFALAHHKAWDLLVNVHDAVVGQAPVEEIPEVCGLARKLFARDLISPRGEKFNMKSEAMAGPTWNKNDMQVIE